MGLFGILLGLVLLVWLAYRGWSILLLAPGAALIAAAFAGGPLLAYWTCRDHPPAQPASRALAALAARRRVGPSARPHPRGLRLVGGAYHDDDHDPSPPPATGLGLRDHDRGESE